VKEYKQAQKDQESATKIVVIKIMDGHWTLMNILLLIRYYDFIRREKEAKGPSLQTQVN
jgi:hypothetical protein